MRIGLFALGIGAAAHPDVVREVAQAAERAGVATLWAAEHVVLFDRYESSYPYAPDGAFPLGADADWLDPFVALTFAAAVTSRVRLATGICLVPEHNPLILAKTVASLDRLAGGRFALGVGIGWSAEEFRALGIPFERRAQRTREYIGVMRKLWGDGVASHDGEFVRFERRGQLPQAGAGREGAGHLRRGERGGAPPRRGVRRRLVRLQPGSRRSEGAARAARAPPGRQRAEAGGRGGHRRARTAHRIAPEDLARYRDLGVSEVVLMAALPADHRAAAARVERFAREWVDPAGRL